MRSILLSLIAFATARLNRLYAAINSCQSEWIMNRSGHSSFRPEVIQEDNGFTAIIHRRTGHSSKNWTYNRCADAGRFTSSRKAMKAGRLMALQLANLRYRFD